ncbi:MAG: prepilin-type N-terminal cleavage/methylation domain-containing protein [Planctomycetes bacterium]|nr:prepilin-type N-terminal cleavage/methylation domain-containing protein [Planctomycetota bacterium]
MTKRRAFTLIEVLAALVLLGLLAVAIVPLQRTLVVGHARTERCAEARAELVRQVADPAFRLTPGERPLGGQADLVLRVEPLALQPGQPLLSGRAWWRISIRARGVDQPLAQLVSAWPAALKAAP